jgi:PTH2 family peptidyl-tRNA hydrolase
MSSMGDAPSMALIVRLDLGLSTGKTAAQCAHAAVDVVQKARRSRLLERWRAGGARKIVLGVEDEAALHTLAARVPQGCYSAVVRDAGHTEVPSGTVTVLGLLGPRRSMDALLAHLDAL